MKLALLTDANPKQVSKSHPSYIGSGRWKLATNAKSKLVGRRIPLDKPTEKVIVVNLSDIFEGECALEILIIEAHPEDSRISVFAERLANV